MKKTENDLNMRHLNMMGAHEDIAKHTKDNLMYNNELGHKQITAHITNGTDFSGMSKEEIEIYSSEYSITYKKDDHASHIWILICEPLFFTQLLQ